MNDSIFWKPLLRSLGWSRNSFLPVPSSAQSNQPEIDVSILAISEEPQMKPVGWIQHMEIWSGRLAMFGLTTLITTIAINPR